MFLMMLVTFDMSATYRYRLYLNGKPESELCHFSDRALSRREAQRIECDSTDYVVSPVYISALQQSGLKVVVTSRWLNTVVVGMPDGEAVEDEVWSQFDFLDSVVCVSTDADQIRKPKKKDWVTDASVASLSVVDNYMRPHKELKVTSLYDAGYKGQGKLIAVLDGGFLGADKQPSINKNLIGVCDMFEPTDSVYIFEEEEHGTHCLSVMSSDGSLKLLGSAPEAEYFLIRTECSQSETLLEEDMWVAGAELADSIGADLINSSLGYMTFDDPEQDHLHDELAKDVVFISRGAQIAASKGMLVCVAAGNERQTDWRAINFPADARDVLAVGALTKDLVPSAFTSPGFLSPYVKPDVACRGTNAFVLDPYSGNPAVGSGTSYATPLMCGACASLWSAVPTLTAMEVVDIVRKSAHNYDNPDILSGYGLPDFEVALELAKQVSCIEQIEENRGENSFVGTYGLSGLKLNKGALPGFFVQDGKLYFICK